MSAISLKSITGITSITTPTGVDNQLTLHNNNTTEAVKLDTAGNLHFHNHLNITGISTAANFKTGTSNLHNTGLNVFDLDVDGHTNLDNVSIAGVTTTTGNIHLNSTDKKIYLTSDYDQYITANAASNYMAFAAGNQERLRIMSGGSIGIRTTTGSNTVNIGGAAGLGVKFHNFTSGNSSYITVESGDKLQSNVGGTGYFTWVTGGSEKLRIQSDGKVGINTTTPDTQLEVFGGSTSIQVGNQSGTGRFGADGTSTKIGSHSNHHLDLFTNGVANTRLRITSDGKVGINKSDPRTELDLDDGQLSFSHRTDYSIRFYNGAGNNWSSIHNPRTSDGTNYSDLAFKVASGEALRITSDGKVGINEASPSNQLHIAGTTSTSAGGLLRLDATTGDNFIILDNTNDSTEWVIGNDQSARDEFRMYYDGGSGYGTEIINIDGTTNNGVVTIDGGTTTLVNIKGDSGGTAGLRLGGDSGQDQCTGFVEVHQDATHGGGMFYNGDGSPSFATGESADYFSLFRASGGSRHSVMRWFHDSNDCHVQGNMLIDNGATSLLRVTGDNSGTAGVSAGGDSGQTQCTGYLEVHQDRLHGGGMFYNGDGSPAFATGETADTITFYRMNNGARSEVFSYPYNSDVVTFNDEIRWGHSHANYNSYNFMGGYFQAGTSGQTASNAPNLGNTLHYGYGYQEAYSTSGGIWTNPYPDLVLAYHTGVSLGGHPNYNGCRFFSDHPSSTSSVILNIGNGNNGVNVPHSLSKGGGSFRIRHPHPSKKYTHDLQHSFIEGPQCDNIYRGKISLTSGSATVNLDTVSNMTDGTFVLLNRDIQCFTSNETGWGAVKGSVSGNILTITAQDNSSTDTISWMVIGERQDDKIKSPEMDITDADGKLITEPLTIESSHM